MSDLEAFRSDLRAWLNAACPAEMRKPMSEQDICWGGRNWQFQSEAQRDWLHACIDKGFTVPQWPAAYGGAGLDADKARVLDEEMKRINARPPLQSFGIWMLGPALLAFGSEAQKAELLPPIARGEIRWCQGYSEPNAGSDLASLQCKGVEDGDDFLVTGQKVWTSYADKADWIFCLVRTEPEASKHKGISFLLFDMASKGVEARPIPLISGNAPFCETFFDTVRVPQHQIVGKRGEGWTIAKYLLTHERESIGAADGAHFMAADPYRAALAAVGLDENGRLDDPMMRAEIGRFLVDEITFTAHMDAARTYSRAGNEIGARSAVLKYIGAELNKRRLSLAMQGSGQDALIWSGDGAGNQPQLWLRTKANSIEGGTSEVMLSIVSKAILELPS